MWYVLTLWALFVLIILLGKKFGVQDELAPIKDVLIDIIKNVEYSSLPSKTGEEKFNKAVTIAESRLTPKQHKTIEKSIFKSLPNLVQHVFNAVELLLVLKGKK